MGCRILLVEAETISRRKITELLISEGYSVEEADTGSAALHLLESSNFDVVVSDLHLLGRITGADVVDFAALRNHGVITILVGRISDLRSALSCKAIFISKPLQLNELRLKIGLLLLHRGAVSRLTPATRSIIGNIRSQRVRSLILANRSRELLLCLQQSFSRNVELRKRASELQDDLRQIMHAPRELGDRTPFSFS